MSKKNKILILISTVLVIIVASFGVYKISNKNNDVNKDSKKNVVKVFAGSGKIGAVDGKNLDASFNLPYSLSLDKGTGFLVADCYNNKIRKIKDGNVTTIAGYSDKIDSFGLPKGGYIDGLISIAKFNRPRAAVADSKGNIFVSDTGNNVIRKISNGVVYTFAGNVEKGYQDGKGTQAKFNNPSGLAIDNKNNIYVADTFNNVIRKITPEGDVTTIAGKFDTKGDFKNGKSSQSLFNEPEDVGLDSKGTIYVLDTGNQLVRKITNGKVSTLAGKRGGIMPSTNYAEGSFKDGTGSKAKFNFPKGFYVTSQGVVFMADTWNEKIRVITPSGKVTTIAGSGTAGNKLSNQMTSEFNGPNSVLYNNGILYVSDMRNNVIKSFTIDLKNYVK